MTTKLAGAKTFFLPLNRGAVDGGARNPHNPDGYATAYLWEEILNRDSILNILQHYMHLDVDPKTKKETMIFPRYHQLDVTRKLLAHSRKHGAGQQYLVQHSAGSGKSNSIAWLAYQLSSLHDITDRTATPNRYS